MSPSISIFLEEGLLISLANNIPTNSAECQKPHPPILLKKLVPYTSTLYCGALGAPGTGRSTFGTRPSCIAVRLCKPTCPSECLVNVRSYGPAEPPPHTHCIHNIYTYMSFSPPLLSLSLSFSFLLPHHSQALEGGMPMIFHGTCCLPVPPWSQNPGKRWIWP